MAFKSTGAFAAVLSAIFLQYLAVDVVNFKFVFNFLGILVFSAQWFLYRVYKIHTSRIKKTKCRNHNYQMNHY